MKPASAAQIVLPLLSRSAGSGLALLGASLLLFTVVRAAPGLQSDTQTRWLVPSAGEPSLPTAAPGGWLPEYGEWLGRALGGDFGRSAVLQQGRPVTELLVPAARRSLTLAATGLTLSVVGALALALVRAYKPRSRGFAVLSVASHLLSTLPVFFYTYAAVAAGNRIVAWGVREGFWALPGWFPFPSSHTAWTPWLAAALVLALGDGLFLDLYQRFRSELDHARSATHLVGVRLLGLSVPWAVVRGVLPGATSHLSQRLGFLVGSLVVLESALGWPGLGFLAWRSAAERDLPVLLAVALTLAAGVELAALGAEVVRRAADPRGGSSG